MQQSIDTEADWFELPRLVQRVDIEATDAQYIPSPDFMNTQQTREAP